MKQKIIKSISNIREKLWALNVYMYNNPELGNQEYNAAQRLSDLLEENEFTVEKKAAGITTAFKAVYKSEKAGPSIAYLCEYDALPEIGHGCGHNLIGVMSAGAGIGLKAVIDEIGGCVAVIGTPAEECDGAKVYMCRENVFADIDAAMLLHPADKSYTSGKSLAIEALRFVFLGKSCHAAKPEQGLNALDAVVHFFNGINALRHYIDKDAKIHGIIKEGGVAANIIPERAVADFYIRAPKVKTLTEMCKKVEDIARGAALMAGCSVEISNYEIGYQDMLTNSVLSDLFTKNLKSFGISDIEEKDGFSGSIDMGNVSQLVPSIHPYIGICDSAIAGHTKEFAAATITERACDKMMIGAFSMALTGYDFIVDKAKFGAIKKEFNERIQ